MDGQRFWKKSEVPAIVAKLKSRMNEALEPVYRDSTDPWEDQNLFGKYRDAQQTALKDRIERANAVYDDLARRAAAPDQGR
jgi:hypothetical protein